ncbi:hypothetical protein [Halonotius roseus]|uniref:DUF8139 domain-containing protein n=1 Tax=Halonotius roseus TaxID=2511997 RepID=A0A544QR33_9EURY|nr:hypothetical protein [Halonotius roseus]TQQ81906.1 hypothetical protein EWF95_02910 [Halonotius roseus]
MQRFTVDDDVRIDIPTEDDPDHERYHRRRGEVVGVLQDDAGEATGDARDNIMYRVELENGEVAEFRWRDLRPA